MKRTITDTFPQLSTNLSVNVDQDGLDKVEAVLELLLLLGPVLGRLDQRLDQQRVLGYP